LLGRQDKVRTQTSANHDGHGYTHAKAEARPSLGSCGSAHVFSPPGPVTRPQRPRTITRSCCLRLHPEQCSQNPNRPDAGSRASPHLLRDRCPWPPLGPKGFRSVLNNTRRLRHACPIFDKADRPLGDVAESPRVFEPIHPSQGDCVTAWTGARETCNSLRVARGGVRQPRPGNKKRKRP